MEQHTLELSQEEYEKLNSQYPRSLASGLIGKRAEEIVRIYFQKNDPACHLAKPEVGADLRVVRANGETLDIEVKGTEAIGLAWPQLKVSSQASHRSLVERRIPVYRVSEAFEKSPTIFILLHGRDFTLEAEPRWAFKPIRAATEAPRTSQVLNPTPSTGTPEVESLRVSKWDALKTYLDGQKDREVTLYFRKAPRLIGFEFPASAFNHRPFWANQSDTSNRPWARAWQEAGWRVDEVQQSGANGWVRFKRVR